MTEATQQDVLMAAIAEAWAGGFGQAIVALRELASSDAPGEQPLDIHNIGEAEISLIKEFNPPFNVTHRMKVLRP